MKEKVYEFSDYDFKELMREEKDIDTLQRLCALYHKSRGKTANEVGEWLLMRPADVRKLVERFYEIGISCVKEELGGEEEPLLSAEEFEEFKEQVVVAQEMQGDGRHGCRDILSLVKEHFSGPSEPRTSR